MRLIIGMGNPGATYARTRHNIGILVLEQAAARWAITLRQRGTALRGTGRVGADAVELAGTLDWMNVSGPPVRALLDEFGLAPEHLIVIHDDLDLEFGRLRIKQTGGHGGHNGIRSLLASLDSSQFIRVKIGIGRPVIGQESADYVLERFSKEEQKLLEPCLERAVDAVECVIERGVAAAMNQFNVRESGGEVEEAG